MISRNQTEVRTLPSIKDGSRKSIPITTGCLVRERSRDKISVAFDCSISTIPLKSITRRQQATKTFPVNFMRHYYDVYCLLDRPDVQAFLGTGEYEAHKRERFRGGDNKNIAENPAFVLSNPETRKLYVRAFGDSTALYYGTKPTLEQVLGRISAWIDRM